MHFNHISLEISSLYTEQTQSTRSVDNDDYQWNVCTSTMTTRRR